MSHGRILGSNQMLCFEGPGWAGRRVVKRSSPGFRRLSASLRRRNSTR
jgi:hypothetical protein